MLNIVRRTHALSLAVLLRALATVGLAAVWFGSAVPSAASYLYCCYSENKDLRDPECAQNGSNCTGNCWRQTYTDYGCGWCGHSSCNTVSRIYTLTDWRASCINSMYTCVCSDDWTIVGYDQLIDEDSCYTS